VAERLKAAVCYTSRSVSAIVIFPRKSFHSSNIADRAIWLLVGSGGLVFAAHRDNLRDNAAFRRVSVYVKY